MKNISPWLNGVSILLVILMLAFLVKKSLPLDVEEHQQYLQTLDAIGQENTNLNREIIQSKYELLASYNLFAHRLNKLDNTRKDLQNIPSFIKNKDRRELEKFIQDYAKLLEQKKKLTQEFKTENAILENSLSYLPILVNQFKTNFILPAWDKNLLITLNETLHNLILYNTTSDRYLIPLINSKITRLKQLEKQRVLGGNDILVRETISHATVILKHKPELEEITQELLKLDLYERTEELETIYNYKYENTLASINLYRIYGFSWLLIVTITIAYLIISNLSKTNRSIISLLENFTEELETKVEARTAELATSTYEAERAKNKAEEANRAKSRFLANMSHELRTPLNAILGFTQIMSRDRSLSEENKDHISIISRSGEHLLNLINDILEMSKIEAGQISLNNSSFDLHRLLDSLEEMFYLRANSKNLQLLVERSSNLPEHISTDESKLTQILINLLGNALKFTEEGGVILRIDFRPTSKVAGLEVKTLNYLHFEVEDTGVGIAAEEINKLFVPFEQTEAGRKSQQGTGLGLPISEKFVQLMGGTLSVKSTESRGTTFSFDIVIDIIQDPNLIYETRRHSRIIGLEPDQPEYRILAVDDRAESRLLLIKLLSSLGFQVGEASNGQEAVEVWKMWSPNLILMDMRMPVMDGYEATKVIKSYPQGASCPIVALTASAFEEERAEILAAGCDEFLRKPFREDILLEAIGKHLNVRYVYEDSNGSVFDSNSDTKAKKASGEKLTSASLSIMSQEWLDRLLEAAEQVDNKELFELIEQIPSEYEFTAETLTDLVRNFRCDKIIDLIESAK